MQLRQLKLDFVPDQDRLLLRISTSEAKEVLLWLTRRCVKMMWPLLIRMVESSPRVQLAATTPEARAALVGIEHRPGHECPVRGQGSALDLCGRPLAHCIRRDGSDADAGEQEG